MAKENKQGLRADMYLPLSLLVFAIFLFAIAAGAIVVGAVTKQWGFYALSLGFGVLGAFAVLCWKNQKIVIVDEIFFEYTTMFGKTRRYAFADIKEFRQHPDSTTMIVADGKVHIEAMAIKSDRLIEKLLEVIGRQKAPLNDPRLEFVENLERYISVLRGLTEFTVTLDDGRRDYHPVIREMERAFYASDVIDTNYSKTAPELMEKVKENVRILTEEQVCSCLTLVFRAEHFGEGAMLPFIEDGRMLLLLERLYDFQV